MNTVHFIVSFLFAATATVLIWVALCLHAGRTAHPQAAGSHNALQEDQQKRLNIFELTPSHDSASDCEMACPNTLNCSEWKECAFHHPDLCSGIIFFCRGEKENVKIVPMKFLQISYSEFYRNLALPMLLVLILTTILPMVVVLACLFHRHIIRYDVRDYELRSRINYARAMNRAAQLGLPLVRLRLKKGKIMQAAWAELKEKEAENLALNPKADDGAQLV